MWGDRVVCDDYVIVVSLVSLVILVILVLLVLLLINQHQQIFCYGSLTLE